jgi:hypothetical protein
MNPGLMDNFYSMAGEYYRLTGKKVGVNSGKRSSEKQAALYAANPAKAAKPGYSMHEFGLAIDINSADANLMESMGLFKKYGFVRPISNEAWHVEPLAIQGMKSAIRRGKEEAVIAKTGNNDDSAKSKTESEGAPQTAVATQTPAKPAAQAVAPTSAQGATAMSTPTPTPATAPAPTSNQVSPPTTATASAPSLKDVVGTPTPSPIETIVKSVVPELPSAAMLTDPVTAPKSIAADVGAELKSSFKGLELQEEEGKDYVTDFEFDSGKSYRLGTRFEY